MVANEKWFGGGDANFYNGVATQSLRVESGDAGGLSRTVGSSITNRKKFTISAWVKPTHVTGLTSSGSARMFAGYGASGQYGQIGFYEDQFYFYEYNNASYLRTTQLFRDRTAWYNIQVIVDTTESTAGDRNKVYVNGSRVTDFSTQTNYSLNYDSNWNIADSSTSHRVGTSGDTGGNLYQPFSGYISDFHFIDGSAVASTNFGELKNGVWIPKKYSGSYGYGGYHLEFKQTGTSADASGIGADTSGNNLHFTVTNYVASDSNIPDSPENNFATINSLFKHSNMTFSEGNLKYTTSTNQRGVMGNFSIPIGTGQKYYFEYIHTSWASSAGDDAFVGLNIDTVDVTTNRGGNNTAYSYGANSGAKVIAGTESSYGSSGWTTNDVIGIAVDRENNTINFAKNNTYQGTFAIPSTGNLFAWAGSGGGSSSASGTFNFGQDSSFVGVLTAQNNSDGNGNGDFYYSPPSGFLALCTASLSEPLLGANSDEQADDHFNIITWTGNDSTRTLTGVNFQPDLVWIKTRNQANEHTLFDSSRGVEKHLESNATTVETTQDQYGYLSAFTADGFTVVTGSSGYHLVNHSSNTFVAWNWKANANSTTTNDASATGVGTIDSVYQANTTAGFSIVTYTGTGSNGTLAHGLGSAPKLMFIKGLSSGGSGVHNWIAYHGANGSDPETDYLYLSLTSATDDSDTIFNDTAPTSTVFSLGSHVTVNESGINYVAYIWAEIEGFSKFGTYTGNGNDDGAYIHLGFKPKLFVVKRVASTNDWQVMDSARNTTNVMDGLLFWNLTNAETSDASYNRDFLANGVKIRGSESYVNASGGTFIYMAWAEMPFKYANAF